MTRGQEGGATRGDATTSQRNEATREWHREKRTRGQECGVTRGTNSNATRGNATTSRCNEAT